MNAPLPDDWLERLRAQDHEAFEAFVRLHHGAATRLARRLLRNADDAQEIVQEAFLAAYEGIGGYAGRASLQTWLLSILYRKAVDRIRRLAGEGIQLGGVLDDDALWKIAQSVPQHTDWGRDPEQNFRQSELSALLQAALGKLPPESRAVFELRDLQGLSSREAAEVLGMNEGAVRVRLHRVRQFLMQELHGPLGVGSGDKGARR